jgi:hypothetical protein
MKRREGYVAVGALPPVPAGFFHGLLLNTEDGSSIFI